MDLKLKLLLLDNFIDNDYLDKYVYLMLCNKLTKQEKFKTQSHHIIPRCYYKYSNIKLDNSPENKVNLSYKDHVLAHYYLYMCTQSNLKSANLCAIRRMLNVFNKAGNTIDLGDLETIQTIYEESKHLKCIHDDTPSKISKPLKGRISITDGKQFKYIWPSELDNYISNGWWVGHNKQTVESKKRISDANLGRITISKDGIRKNVKPDELDSYILNGWQKGLGYKRESNIKGKVAVNLDGATKYVSINELDYYLSLGYAKGSAKLKEPRKFRDGAYKIYTKERRSQCKKGLVAINKHNICKYVNKLDIDDYINLGWSLGTGKHGTGPKGKKWINNGIKEIYVYLTDLNSYINNGWRIGRLDRRNKEVISC